jgi:Virulence activator alpha C-term
MGDIALAVGIHLEKAKNLLIRIPIRNTTKGSPISAVKIFAGHVAPNQIILAELKRHQKAHSEKLSTYKDLEQHYFQNPQELSESAKFRYLTLLNGITYETHWLAWSHQAIQLLNQTIKKL